MPISVFIPTALRGFAGGQSEIVVPATTAGEALKQVTALHAELRQHLFDDKGGLRSFVNVYVNDEDIRYQSGLDTPLADGGSLMIVPSIAGGTSDLPELTNEEVGRYSRHLILPEFGVTGQRKLKKASVLLVGTGGLGAPLGMYLAAAGVGKLGIVDFDNVDASNLQRQIIHGTRDIGRPKIASAKDRLADVNPYVNVVGYETRMTAANALEIIKDYDVVADGTDNYPTRYLVNERAYCSGSRTFTARSSASRDRPASSAFPTDRATAASIRSRRPPASCRPAPRAESWACSRESSARSRRPRRSS
jgi:adenylyltransferase/sulfurtransferase